MKVLILGAIGDEVRALQSELRLAGFDLVADGHFGEATEAAVKSFQQRAGLVVDGVAGEKTRAALLGKPLSKLMKENDLQAAAELLGVPLPSIKAVNAVESAGKGFQADGRPVILFERHVMYQRLAAAGADAAGLAERFPALINPKRGGYAGGASEHQRMGNAGLVSQREDIAHESASWGAFQIMGYHWKALGYASICEFVTVMTASESSQLFAFVRFIEASEPLHKALKAKKWADFARLYNGPAYKANLYDVKLQRAFERFSGVVA